MQNTTGESRRLFVAHTGPPCRPSSQHPACSKLSSLPGVEDARVVAARPAGATSRQARPRHATPRHATPRHVTSRHVTSRHVTPRHATPRAGQGQGLSLSLSLGLGLSFAAMACPHLRAAARHVRKPAPRLRSGNTSALSWGYRENQSKIQAAEPPYPTHSTSLLHHLAKRPPRDPPLVCRSFSLRLSMRLVFQAWQPTPQRPTLIAVHILGSGCTGKKKAHLPKKTGFCIVNADPRADQKGMSSSMSSKPLAGRAACGWAMGGAAGG